MTYKRNGNKMTKKEFAKEVGMVAAIISDVIFEKLYEAWQQKGSGYISTSETVAEWALEFALNHESTIWENALENGIKPLSNQITEIICFDDAIMDFAHFKLEQFKK